MRVPVRWRTLAALALVMPVIAAVTSDAAAYSRVGEYQNMGDAARYWQSPYPLPGGIPMVDYGTFRARNPVTSAQYGLANWSLWKRYGDRSRLRRALHVANWLVATQRRSGKWVYRFDYVSPGTTMVLRAPWSSALAQGQAISMLRRAYAHTGRDVFLRRARRALRPLRRDVADGGLAVRRAEGVLFEEYPTERPSLPLNGHLQALIGLYDLADLSARARNCFRRGAATIVRVLHEYDAGGGWSLYDLVHEAGYPPVLASADYHAAHVRLLRLIDELWPHHVLREWADRWDVRAVSVRLLDETFQHSPRDAPRIMLDARERSAASAQPLAQLTVEHQRP